MKRLTDAVAGQLQGLTLPRLGRDAEIDVYLIHNSRDPEDYFFLFDFEEFVERSQGGVFVRPKLRVFAGRDDFSRTGFARQFRAVFAREFDRMRGELAQTKRGGGGWLNWQIGGIGPLDLIGGLVANLVLAVALSLGRKLIGQIALPAILKGKSAEARLVDEIEQTKGRVETALEAIDVTIHPELHAFAYRDGPPGRIGGMDRDAWPLPGYVRTHLDAGSSGSWW